MAYWPEFIREKPFGSLIAVVSVSTVSIGAWFAAASWGSGVWIVVVVLALACIALLRWYRGKLEARVRAAADTFSFGDVVARMHAKDKAQAIITARP